jgi:hypothetical protein
MAISIQLMDIISGSVVCCPPLNNQNGAPMATKDELLIRAERLRRMAQSLDDPLARRILTIFIESLEEAAADMDEIPEPEPPNKAR